MKNLCVNGSVGVFIWRVVVLCNMFVYFVMFIVLDLCNVEIVKDMCKVDCLKSCREISGVILIKIFIFFVIYIYLYFVGIMLLIMYY